MEESPGWMKDNRLTDGGVASLSWTEASARKMEMM